MTRNNKIKIRRYLKKIKFFTLINLPRVKRTVCAHKHLKIYIKILIKRDLKVACIYSGALNLFHVVNPVIFSFHSVPTLYILTFSRLHCSILFYFVRSFTLTWIYFFRAFCLIDSRERSRIPRVHRSPGLSIANGNRDDSLCIPVPITGQQTSSTMSFLKKK